MIRIAILASGSGSNAENIARYFQNSTDISIALIAANKADAFVLERAKKLDIPSCVFSKEEMQNGALQEKLKGQKIDWIVLAGFLLRIPQSMVEAFPNKIINIHPALLPNYGGKGMYGMNVHKAVIAAKEKKSGITIHYVNENYDKGAIIFQGQCEITAGDTAEDLAQKIHQLEYANFPKVIDEVITGKSNKC